VSEDSAEEHARIADETRRKAHEAGASAKGWANAQAGRAEADALSGESGEETVRQLGLIYGGLIGIAVVMVQPLIAAPSLDTSAKISVIAFSVAIPLLAALVMVNRQEVFRRRRTPSVTVTIAKVLAQLAALVGIVAGFWHVYWIAGVVFLAFGLVGVLVHSAGYIRLEGYPDEAKRFIEEARRMAKDPSHGGEP
jgi:cation transport ATPase